MLNGKQVLVTGAGGFIASHLVEQLVADGAKVRAFVRYNSRGDAGLLRLLPMEVFSKVEVIAGDLRDSEVIRAAMIGVDTVFHLGALIAIPYSYLHPREVVDTNVIGTLNVLMAARDIGVRRVVHTSTSEVYGTAQYVPIDEAHPLKGQSPYSASKIGADKIAESFYLSFDLPVVTIRPFNAYGPRQSARAVIPTIITQTLTSNEVHLGSLDPSRDFTFVLDTVNGFMRAAQADNVLGEEINLGNDATITIGELCAKIFKISGKSPRLVTDSRRLRPEKSEVLKLQASYKKANKLIGWEPQTPLDEGLSATIKWISEHIDLYKPDQYTL